MSAAESENIPERNVVGKPTVSNKTFNEEIIFVSNLVKNSGVIKEKVEGIPISEEFKN